MVKQGRFFVFMVGASSFWGLWGMDASSDLISCLPADVAVMKVFPLLSYDELVNVACVSKAMRAIVVPELARRPVAEKISYTTHRRGWLTSADRAKLHKLWGPLIGELERHLFLGRVIQDVDFQGVSFSRLIKFNALGKDMRDTIQYDAPHVLFNNLTLAAYDIDRSLPWPAKEAQLYNDLMMAKKETGYIQKNFELTFKVHGDGDDHVEEKVSLLKKMSRAFCCCL